MFTRIDNQKKLRIKGSIQVTSVIDRNCDKIYPCQSLKNDPFIFLS